MLFLYLYYYEYNTLSYYGSPFYTWGFSCLTNWGWNLNYFTWDLCFNLLPQFQVVRLVSW